MLLLLYYELHYRQFLFRNEEIKRLSFPMALFSLVQHCQ
jgi:hypothetical protein